MSYKRDKGEETPNKGKEPLGVCTIPALRTRTPKPQPRTPLISKLTIYAIGHKLFE